MKCNRVRDLVMFRDIVRGKTMAEVARENNLSHARVPQIIARLSRTFIQKCKNSGTPEDFYPGRYVDHYDENEHCNTPETFSFEKEYVGYKKFKHIPRSLKLKPIAGNITELRQYKDFWIHQIEKQLRQITHPK